MQQLTVTGCDKPLSQLSLGTAWFDPAMEGEIFTILDRYVTLGGNVLDTGRFYNGGKSESVVARWLKGRACREQLVITNKACHHYVDENNVHHIEQSRVRPDCITEDLEYSLNNMGLDYFDLYLLHRDDESQGVEGLIDRLERHRNEGLIRAYGVSNWTLPRMEQALQYAKEKGYQGPTVNSPSYSLAKIVAPRFFGCIYADEDYVNWHADKDLRIIAWASLAVGFFSGVYKRDGSAPADIASTYFCDENFARLERVNALAAKKGVTPIQISLAYVLSHPVPMVSVIGPRTGAELESLMQAAELKLSREESSYLLNG